MARRTLLKPHDRQELVGIPTDEDSLIRHYSLSPADRLEIEVRRREHNRLGFALQLCLMRYRPLNIKGAQIYGRPISRLLRSLLDGSYEAQQFGWRGEPEHPTGKSFHSSKVALSLLLSVIDHKSEEGPIKAFRTSRRELITAISAQTGYRSSNNSPQA